METDKKLVEQITSQDKDFAKWYTDVCLKSELCIYSGTKGFVILRPYGYALWENIMHGLDAMFKEKQLLFAKRNGAWICFSHEEIIGKLAERSGEVEELRRALYLSALDISFAKSGGCVVHVNSADKLNVLKHISATDISDFSLAFSPCPIPSQIANINLSPSSLSML